MATMNIKDPRVHELAHELAKLRGTSATAAVRTALENDLQNERHKRNDIFAAAKRLQEKYAGTSHLWLTDDDLYDEDGLPK
ncbi:MAG: type II toxin-antitoxin system VapB family antitoxin [Microbacteriaceae bacterium]|nr:type II toxin-antitoxin system VapB family antitoxin [Microbacteriaceae bacterium]